MPVFTDNIEMKYPSKSNGESYSMPLDIPTRHGLADRWDSGRVILSGQGGSFIQIEPTKVGLSQNQDVRIYLTTSAGYGTSIIETNQSKLLVSRFMQSKKDWLNVEITVVFTYTGGNDQSAVTIGCRGGLQENPCEGFAYKGSLDLDADGGTLAKQLFYPSGNERRLFTTTRLGSSIKNKTVALKFVVYNLKNGGSEATNDPSLVDGIKLELYGQIVGSTSLKKLADTRDIHDWGSYGVCNGPAGVLGKWAGPLAFVQWGDGANIQLQALTVREIDARATFTTVPTGSQTFPPSGTPSPPAQDSSSNETALDDYGVKKIYQSKKNGNKFYPPAEGLLNDSRFDANGANIKHEGSGVYKVTGKSRMLFYSTKIANQRGENFVYDTYDFQELQKKGHWEADDDWRNTETTYYVKCSSTSGSADELSCVCRSVRHDEGDHNGCGGSSYHGSLRFTDGSARLIKEPRHVDYTDYLTSDKKLGNILGKWIGFKFVVYNKTDTTVQMEVWLDKDNKNDWVKYIEFLDDGSWDEGSSEGMKPCGALKKGAAITWGGVKNVMKDNGLSIEFKKYSIREITGAKIGDSVPDSGSGGTGSLSRQFNRWIGIYNVIVDTSGTTCTGFTGSPPSTTYHEVTDLTVTSVDTDKQISGNWDDEDDRKRVGWYCNSDSSKMKGIKPKRIQAYLKKVGSPSGNCEVTVRDGNNNLVVSYGTKAASSLSTSRNLETFTNDDAPDSMPNGILKNWKISVEYSSGNDTDYITAGVNDDDKVDGSNTCEYQYETEPGPGYSNVKHTDREMCGKIWT